MLFAVSTDSTFNNYFRKDIGGWIAGDATYSIALSETKTLWLFGDTFIGEVENDNSISTGATLIRNSGVLQNGENLTSLFGGTRENPQALILTDNPDSTWYWPEHGIVKKDTLFIFLAKYKKGAGTDGFNFVFISNEVALFSYPELTFDTIIEISYYESNGVIYGDHILEFEDYYYIYGRKEEDSDFNIPYPHVARTKKSNFLDNWEFYNGSSWSVVPSESYRINNFQVSQQYGVLSYGNKYILLSQDIWLSPEIWSFTSLTPMGPWENKTLLYTTPYPYQDMFTYNAYPHPQFTNEKELLVSYNSNGDLSKIFNNVELYRPRFIRVPFKDIDPDFNDDTISKTYLRKSLNHLSFCNYPNPCNTYTIIRYQLNTSCSVNISIYDLTGRTYATYVKQLQQAGIHQINIPVTELFTGIYVYTIEAAGFIGTGRFTKISGSD